jgi:uncharacterized protein YueI
MAGYLALDLFYVYNLTPRQFYNISKGCEKRFKEQTKKDLILNRRLAFAFSRPYIKEAGLTEEKFMPMYFDKETSATIDLENEIAQVEKNKEFWARIDEKRMAKA